MAVATRLLQVTGGGDFEVNAEAASTLDPCSGQSDASSVFTAAVDWSSKTGITVKGHNLTATSGLGFALASEDAGISLLSSTLPEGLADCDGTYGVGTAGVIVNGTVVSRTVDSQSTSVINFRNVSGGSVEWTVSSCHGSSDSYVEFKYANGHDGDRPMQLTVNGVVLNSSLSFPVTKSLDECTSYAEAAAPEVNRSYSSVSGVNYTKGEGHAQSAIDSTQGWTAGTNAVDQYLQLDLTEAKTVKGAVIQALHDDPTRHVSKYEVQHSLDGTTWTAITGQQYSWIETPPAYNATSGGTVTGANTTAANRTLAECKAECADGTWTNCVGFSRGDLDDDVEADCWWVTNSSHLADSGGGNGKVYKLLPTGV